MPAIFAAESLSPSHDAIVKAVDYVLDGARTVRVTSSGTVIPEVTQNPHGVFVHLVNWNEAAPVENVRVSLRVPAGQISGLTLLSPDRETPGGSLKFEQKDGRIEFTVPRLVCYAVVAVRP
jgi:hypothetical protein